MDVGRRDQILAVRSSLGRAMAAGHRLRGCTEQEIDDLCINTGVQRERLPAGYGEFLAVAGREHGEIARGSSSQWPTIMSLTKSAAAFADDLGVGAELDALSGSHLALLCHQGHSYLLLIFDDEHDRVVLLDESDPFLHIAEEPVSFPTWLDAEVTAAIDRRPDPHEIPPPFA